MGAETTRNAVQCRGLHDKNKGVGNSFLHFYHDYNGVQFYSLGNTGHTLVTQLPKSGTPERHQHTSKLIIAFQSQSQFFPSGRLTSRGDAPALDITPHPASAGAFRPQWEGSQERNHDGVMDDGHGANLSAAVKVSGFEVLSVGLKDFRASGFKV